MTKLLLSLAVLSTFAAPALAGRLDDADPSVRQTYTAPAGNLDYTATRAITGTPVAPSTHDDSSIARGAQGAFFGANGR